MSSQEPTRNWKSGQQQQLSTNQEAQRPQQLHNQVRFCTKNTKRLFTGQSKLCKLWQTAAMAQQHAPSDAIKELKRITTKQWQRRVKSSHSTSQNQLQPRNSRYQHPRHPRMQIYRLWSSILAKEFVK